MFFSFKLTRKHIAAVLISAFVLSVPLLWGGNAFRGVFSEEKAGKKNFIKWVDFNVSYEALRDAMNLDIKTNAEENHINWIDALSYLAAKNGGSFRGYSRSQLEKLAEAVKEGKSIKELSKNLKSYDYYHKAYSAVLEEYIGSYGKETPIDGDPETKEWLEYYGLKVFSPIAAGFGYNHYDDFGSSRSYGYARKHLGHDLMGETGTPIVAAEGGRIEALGWNQYGGWRIGIRSRDKKRYYYYAHLRKDHPYRAGLKEGDEVEAGEVIGYLGMTGYSTKENVNNIDKPHLHFGIQLIFDESQKDGNGEIWIDCYALTKLLGSNRAEVYYDKQKKEYFRKDRFYDLENRG